MGKYGYGYLLLRGVALVAAILFCVDAYTQAQQADYLDCLLSFLLMTGAACVLMAPRLKSLLGFVPAVLVLSYAIWLRWREAEALRPVAELAVQMTQSRLPQGGWTRPAAKAVVWNLQTRSLDPLHYQLPRSCRGRITDSPLTVFVVASVSMERVEGTSRYKSRLEAPVSGPISFPGSEDRYRETVRIGLVNWPEGTFVGWRDVQARVPAQAALLRTGKVGEAVLRGVVYSEVVDWLRATQSPAPKDPLNLDFFLASFLPAPDPTRGAKSSRERWTEAEARAEAVRRYPELKIANSALNKAYVERFVKMKQEDPAYFSRPDWPIRLAEEVGR